MYQKWRSMSFYLKMLLHHIYIKANIITLETQYRRVERTLDLESENLDSCLDFATTIISVTLSK